MTRRYLAGWRALRKRTNALHLAILCFTVIGFMCLLITNVIYRKAPTSPSEWVAAVIIVFGLAALALALTGVRRIEEASYRAIERMKAVEHIYAVSLEVVSQLDKERVLSTIVEQAADLTKSEACCIFTYDKEEDVLRLTAVTPPERCNIGLKVKRGESTSGIAIETGRYVIVNEDYFEWLERIGQRPPDPMTVSPGSMLTLPLIVDGEAIGTMAFSDKRHNSKYTDDDAHLVESFARMAAIAMNNATIYGDIEVFNRYLSDVNDKKDTQLSEAQKRLLHQNVRLQKLLRQMTAVKDSERARVSRIMHDSTMQLVVAAMYAAQAVEVGLDRVLDDDGISRRNIHLVKSLLGRIESDIHSVVDDTKGVCCSDIVSAIKTDVESIGYTTGVDCSFNASIDYDGIRIANCDANKVHSLVHAILQHVVTQSPNVSSLEASMALVSDMMRVSIRSEGVHSIFSGDHPDADVTESLVGIETACAAEGWRLTCEVEETGANAVILEIPLKGILEGVAVAGRCRVAIGDAHEVFRYGLESLLSQDPKVDVVLKASDASTLIAGIERTRPDVVLLDVGMPGTDGASLATKIVRSFPRARVVLLGDCDDEDRLIEALGAGVYGYLSKGAASETILAAVREVHAGHKLLEPAQADSVIRRLTELVHRQEDGAFGLSENELRLLSRLSHGDAYEEAARRLYMSEPTVKRMVRLVQAKLDARNRTEAVAEAIRHGLI